jgi:cation diffusion facilitator family transporter
MNRLQTLRLTLMLCALLNTVLGISKLYIGYHTDTKALMADGIHSFADLFTDIMVYIFARISEIPPDENHPYGHRKFETLASFFFSVLISSIGVFIIYEAIIDDSHLISSSLSSYAIGMAVISVVTNELMYWYVRSQSIKLSSRLLMANAVHQRIDAGTSIIALVSIIVSSFGYIYFDAIGAFIIAIFILRFSSKLFIDSLKELLDEGVDPTVLKAYRECILSTEGVSALHLLRTRLMSKQVFLDVHIVVAPFVSVSEGHLIADRVEKTLVSDFTSVIDVTVHVDSENDHNDYSYVECSRREILNAFNDAVTLNDETIVIHYYKGKFDVACHLESPISKQLKDSVKLKLSNLSSQFGSVKFWIAD